MELYYKIFELKNLNNKYILNFLFLQNLFLLNHLEQYSIHLLDFLYIKMNYDICKVNYILNLIFLDFELINNLINLMHFYMNFLIFYFVKKEFFHK